MPLLRSLSALTLALLFVGAPAAQDHHVGALEAGDETLSSGEYVDTYTVPADRGQWIEVVMTSDAIDPYLIMKPPSCTPGACDDQADNDDFFATGDAFLWVEAKEAGTWEILATSYAPGETGRYTVEVRVHDAGSLPTTPYTTLGTEGREEAGSLEEGDGTLRSGEYRDSFPFVARAGDRVAVDLTSSEFDTYLILQMPSGEQEDNDDWGDSTEHSRIALTLPEDGMYTVLVTTYEPGESGRYELSIRPEGRGEVTRDPFSK